MPKTTLRFTKMHGLGNDFAIIDDREQSIQENKLNISGLANRHKGIGFDQLLILRPSTSADIFCKIYNADGSEARQCGNGLRCIVRYLHEQKIINKKTMLIETMAGVFSAHINDYDCITIDMGTPLVAHLQRIFTFSRDTISASILSTGNLHAIIQVEKLNNSALVDIARKLGELPEFKEGINIGFMQILAPNHIKLRTFERGAGETYACGSNACAAVVSGILDGWLANEVNVEVSQGFLTIKWLSKSSMQMSGPAAFVFFGELTSYYG